MVRNDSDVFSVSMSMLLFGTVNIPLSTASILLNVFGIFCLITPQCSERLKPPLNILLGTLIGSNTVLHLFNFVFVLCELLLISLNEMFVDIGEVVMMYIMEISMTSSVWLNVFYCCQIVPSQCAVFMWLKKNIRNFIYSALIMDRLLFLFGFIANIAFIIKDQSQKAVGGTDSMQNETNTSMDILFNTLVADFGLRLAYFLLSLCVMSASSCATVHYLWRHMENMKESCGSSSSLQLQAQLRVTVTGIVQAVLYVLCSVLMITNNIIELKFPDIKINVLIICTVISLYTLVTTINTGVGQSVFRQCAIHVYQKLSQTIFS